VACREGKLEVPNPAVIGVSGDRDVFSFLLNHAIHEVRRLIHPETEWAFARRCDRDNL